MEGSDGRNPLVPTTCAACRGCGTVTSGTTDRIGRTSYAPRMPSSVLAVPNREENPEAGHGPKHGPCLCSPQDNVVVLAAMATMGQNQKAGRKEAKLKYPSATAAIHGSWLIWHEHS
jgi:hypothetical protein